MITRLHSITSLQRRSENNFEQNKSSKTTRSKGRWCCATVTTSVSSKPPSRRAPNNEIGERDHTDGKHRILQTWRARTTRTHQLANDDGMNTWTDHNPNTNTRHEHHDLEHHEHITNENTSNKLVSTHCKPQIQIQQTTRTTKTRVCELASMDRTKSTNELSI